VFRIGTGKAQYTQLKIEHTSLESGFLQSDKIFSGRFSPPSEFSAQCYTVIKFTLVGVATEILHLVGRQGARNGYILQIN
jgi:hypothetical protein